NRQLRNRKAAGEHDHDGDNPCEYWAIDKKLGHDLLHFFSLYWHARLNFLQPFNNNFVTRCKSFGDHPIGTDSTLYLQVTLFYLTFAVDNKGNGASTRITANACLWG